MTQKEDLLIKDLSARIFYGTRVKVSNVWDEDKEIEKDIVDSLYCVFPDGYINTSTIDSDIPIKDVKPYLRSMSSMTDEEKEELSNLLPKDWNIEIDKLNTLYLDIIPSYAEVDLFFNIIDWLSRRHFDYNHLIEKGLALEAPEDMY